MKSVVTNGSDAAVAGSFIGGGLVTSFGIAISIALTLLSLLGYAVLKLFTRESSSSAMDMMECDLCSELIRVSAKKCRHCGEFLGSGSWVKPAWKRLLGVADSQKGPIGL